MWTSSATVFATALLLAMTATPIARRLALRWHLVDHPSGRRDHPHPVPLLGGLAIYGAVLGSLLLHPERQAITGLAGLMLGGTAVSFLGVWDDRSGLRVSIKLLGQLLAASVLVVAGVRVALPLPLAVNLALSLTWIVGITNAFNLLDNMDGLSGGVGAVAAFTFLFLALGNGQHLVAPLAAAVLGACIGFLVYNFNPARIFMGDSGSLFLGFILAGLAIKLRFPLNRPQVTWLVPLLVLALPILDTTLVLVSRLRRRRNPFSSPGHDHLSHRLVRAGCTRRQAVLLLYLAAALCGAVGSWVSRRPSLDPWIVALPAAVVGLLLLVLLERPSLLPEPALDRDLSNDR